MRQLAILFIMVTAAGSGCTAAKAALGALGGKPTQVTVINQMPAPSVVAVAPAAAPVAPPAEHHRHGALRALAGGGVAGAVVGGLVAASLHHGDATKGALIGAGVGAASGFVVHVLEN